MATIDPTMESLADAIRDALQAADLAAYGELLDPDVRWGAPGDTTSRCHTRRQVLDWYRRGREQGVRATVTETVVRENRILVSLAVADGAREQPSDGEANRWQVFTVANGKIVDIRGFDDRAAALSHRG